MNKEDKILLLKNKKETLGFNLNHQMAMAIAFLVLSTSICATAILTFNQTFVSLFVVFFYILLLLIFLSKPIKIINQNVDIIKKIDSTVFSLINNKSLDESFIEKIYLN